jgi:hypothetical protein
MEINVIDPTAKQFHTSLGITDLRSDEISAGMDAIFNDIAIKQESVCYAEILKRIAAICNTNKEFAYAQFNNIRYLVHNDMMPI